MTKTRNYSFQTFIIKIAQFHNTTALHQNITGKRKIHVVTWPSHVTKTIILTRKYAVLDPHSQDWLTIAYYMQCTTRTLNTKNRTPNARLLKIHCKIHKIACLVSWPQTIWVNLISLTLPRPQTLFRPRNTKIKTRHANRNKFST